MPQRAHKRHHPELALGTVVAIYFSINAKFSGKYLSKINRDKCLKIWGSKIYLVINAQTPGHKHATPKDVGTSAILAIFWRRVFCGSHGLDREFAEFDTGFEVSAEFSLRNTPS